MEQNNFKPKEFSIERLRTTLSKAERELAKCKEDIAHKDKQIAKNIACIAPILVRVQKMELKLNAGKKIIKELQDENNRLQNLLSDAEHESADQEEEYEDMRYDFGSLVYMCEAANKAYASHRDMSPIMKTMAEDTSRVRVFYKEYFSDRDHDRALEMNEAEN
jgi:chromosome segregation ATPase